MDELLERMAVEYTRDRSAGIFRPRHRIANTPETSEWLPIKRDQRGLTIKGAAEAEARSLRLRP